MKITFITAGAGSTYCGACNQDVSLVRELMALEHEVTLIPLYTPLTVDGHDPSIKQIFYGGINVYLQQKIPFYHSMPAFIDRMLDNPKFLQWVSSFAVNTRPEKLGDMTVSVLKGEEGRQKKELQKLLHFLKTLPEPDMIIITNTMLVALAPAIKAQWNVPVCCQVQGEEVFLQALTSPYCDQAIAELRAKAKNIDCLLAPCEPYAQIMSEFLAVDQKLFEIIPPGVEVDSFSALDKPMDKTIKIGYLSRIQPDKGLNILIDAFIQLCGQSNQSLEVAVAGTIVDKKFWNTCLASLKAAGLEDRLEFIDNPDFDTKLSFLNTLDVFCVPSTFFESRGIAWLEAMAMGIPVVAPDRGIFPEIIHKTGGGILIQPDDAQALAKGIGKMVEDATMRKNCGVAAKNGVKLHYSAESRARKAVEVYGKIIKDFKSDL